MKYQSWEASWRTRERAQRRRRSKFLVLAAAALFCAFLYWHATASSAESLDKIASTPPASLHASQSHTLREVACYYMETNPRLWEDLARYMAQATVKAAYEHDVSVALLASVVAVESEAHPFARSGAGAKGMSQIMFSAHGGRFGLKTERERYDPANNINASAILLKEETERFGLDGGLQAYNLGQTAYRSGKRAPQYVAKVMREMRRYQSI